MYLLRRGFAGVAKQEAAKTPGFGTYMQMADYAFLDRSNTANAIDALNPAVERLKRGLSVVMAPEGTRSWTPRVGKFKKGAFHMAMQAGVPIVPVVIRNAGEIMGRNDQTMRAGTVQVAVLPPISVADWRMDDLDRRVAEVRQMFVDTLEHWPGEARSAPADKPRVAKSRASSKTSSKTGASEVSGVAVAPAKAQAQRLLAVKVAGRNKKPPGPGFRRGDGASRGRPPE
ncbi:MAG TPA: lysophospholipid acyltransferase family protein [Burkholderiaceae bacterium]|nr:lysophospholipid acyltransferase family protein [Burkholderiaceae bacterium]